MKQRAALYFQFVPDEDMGDPVSFPQPPYSDRSFFGHLSQYFSVLWIRIGSDPHHRAGFGSVSMSGI
jgi:hypothetical protein